MWLYTSFPNPRQMQDYFEWLVIISGVIPILHPRWQWLHHVLMYHQSSDPCCPSTHPTHWPAIEESRLQQSVLCHPSLPQRSSLSQCPSLQHLRGWALFQWSMTAIALIHMDSQLRFLDGGSVVIEQHCFYFVKISVHLFAHHVITPQPNHTWLLTPSRITHIIINSWDMKTVNKVMIKQEPTQCNINTSPTPESNQNIRWIHEEFRPSV